ncbi:hypothetical protein KSP40_PGU010255 [Platanthera guangdongensis]|uniref:Uncharacterized protein n=1 Tax=Platanthera guangdongensis TaxID=2320717 RepID=A0ABR2MMX2_9ASPA
MVASDDVLEGEALLLLYSGRLEKDTILVDEGKDDTFVHDYTVDCLQPVVNVSQHVDFDVNHNIEEISMESEVKKDSTEDEKQFTREVHHEAETMGGGSITGESTSNNSTEWRGSTIFHDSETECPFSSSSRSSSNWESYIMFRKYDEEMLFFDKISAKMLAETESFRSKNAKKRSIPKRIISKLMAKPKNAPSSDPYKELESAYVAQVCLAWEVLSWNYNIFQKLKGEKTMAGSCCPARTAQRFQQFQVLLQRFLENEPYEYGRRPEIFARMRLSSPKLLLVPEFLCDEENQEVHCKISTVECISILEDSIETFMDFLKADNKGAKVFFKRKQSIGDLAHLCLLKKINKKKKAKLEEIGRRKKYWKKRKVKEEEEMEAFMAMIDLKVVSRVLRVQRITEEQLHWCEDKMSRVRVWDGKMKRDHSSLFFPVHS